MALDRGFLAPSPRRVTGANRIGIKQLTQTSLPTPDPAVTRGARLAQASVDPRARLELQLLDG